MSEEKAPDILTKAQAKNMVIQREDGMVHTFFNMPFGLLGGDHSRESIMKDIDNSVLLKKTGEQAQRMGHGLVIFPKLPCPQSELLFVETDSK